ncbi:hypothetical protein CEP52_011745 [Fusarium oligoseptatum]|uniref:Uncharacterized protein n=1 Tax=Fusarium oligoseptatum TaxID=2604345 RepID=A0A428T1R2_9HYPO|nr:hypothetical protein CEP52_011745 [Fusarium oligoseptatum]
MRCQEERGRIVEGDKKRKGLRDERSVSLVSQGVFAFIFVPKIEPRVDRVVSEVQKSHGRLCTWRDQLKDTAIKVLTLDQKRACVYVEPSIELLDGSIFHSFTRPDKGKPS